jgi:hypothetical protein
MSFQPIAPPFLTVTGTAPVISDNDGLSPTNIVKAGVPFSLQTHIKFSGSMAGLVVGAPLKLTLQAAAHPVAGGAAASTPQKVITTSVSVFDYPVVLTFAGLAPGVYEATVVLTSTTALNVVTPIAGFESDILVQAITE